MKTNSEKQEVKVVNTPLSFAKQGFNEWIESIKSGIPKYTQFGTNWTLKLPRNVAEPDIKNVHTVLTKLMSGKIELLL